MPARIHAFVQDADDIDAGGGQAVKDHMRAGFGTVITRSYLRAWPPGFGLDGHSLDMVAELA
jgi:hypothetical protein